MSQGCPAGPHVPVSPPLRHHLQDVKSLEAQLDAQQDIAAQLSAELEEKAAELAEVRGGGCWGVSG